MSARADNGCTKSWGGIANLVDCGCVLVADTLSKFCLGDETLDLSLSKLKYDLRVSWRMTEERIAQIV